MGESLKGLGRGVQGQALERMRSEAGSHKRAEEGVTNLLGLSAFLGGADFFMAFITLCQIPKELIK